MSTLEYVAEKQVSLQKEESSVLRNGDKNREIFAKSFVLSENENVTDVTSSEVITKQLFRQKGFISYESWTGSFFISSKVIKVNKDYIQCECIISKESKIIQVRQFPSLLFTHISPLHEGTFVKIKISEKPGSTRTDIIDGKGLGIEKDFEIISFWDDLKDFDNKPF